MIKKPWHWVHWTPLRWQFLLHFFCHAWLMFLSAFNSMNKQSIKIQIIHYQMVEIISWTWCHCNYFNINILHKKSIVSINFLVYVHMLHVTITNEFFFYIVFVIETDLIKKTFYVKILRLVSSTNVFGKG